MNFLKRIIQAWNKYWNTYWKEYDEWWDSLTPEDKAWYIMFNNRRFF